MVAIRLGTRRGTGIHLPTGGHAAAPCVPGSGGADKLSAMSTLVLIRHGESEWNAEGLFTGWVDIGLSGTGTREALAGGKLLRDHGLTPQIVHTSVLIRAIQTA